MKLTMLTERTAEGGFRVSLKEIPAIFYTGKNEKTVVQRMERLVHALRSPNVHVDHITSSGEVILVLDRRASNEEVVAAGSAAAYFCEQIQA